MSRTLVFVILVICPSANMDQATRKSFVLLVLLLLCAFTKAECPLGWLHFDRSCYYFSDDVLDWYKAESSCRGHNARLAEIDSKAQSDYLTDVTRRLGGLRVGYWLGARDDVTEGKWIWASSDLPVNYTDWAPGQPDNAGNHEDCLQLYMFDNHNTNDWNDQVCDNMWRFICEKEYPENGGESIIG